ncbi:unnamed protein product [Protopolystoma xenopodis]|uniref:Uncharacterized protein n=1 Tax=Protopolystoma xenopodis TaxID=117903 RepID=A0A3S5AJ97_9PLAT|nr:unnamed protein product [Protopolystoma xenopodis]
MPTDSPQLTFTSALSIVNNSHLTFLGLASFQFLLYPNLRIFGNPRLCYLLSPRLWHDLMALPNSLSQPDAIKDRPALHKRRSRGSQSDSVGMSSVVGLADNKASAGPRALTTLDSLMAGLKPHVAWVASLLVEHTDFANFLLRIEHQAKRLRDRQASVQIVGNGSPDRCLGEHTNCG